MSFKIIKKIFEKTVGGTEKMKRTDDKLTLIKINFSIKAFSLLKSNKFESLNETRQKKFSFY